jgi:putative glutamine amidotransferase
MDMDPMPVVGVLACQKTRANGSTYSRVNDLVTEQLAVHAGVAVVLIPSAGRVPVRNLVRGLDGLVLPGSGSFVHPARYPPHGWEVPGREYDPARDEVAMELLRQADLKPDLPVLASCRGLQELVVHHGGSLGEIAGSTVPHRLLVSDTVPDRWGPAHTIDIRPGGLLAEIAPPGPVWVNSAHTDQVRHVSPDVTVEASAPDGVIEAVSVGWPERFVLGIQWHFERHTERSAVDTAILREFGRRCQERVALTGSGSR